VAKRTKLQWHQADANHKIRDCGIANWRGQRQFNQQPPTDLRSATKQKLNGEIGTGLYMHTHTHTCKLFAKKIPTMPRQWLVQSISKSLLCLMKKLDWQQVLVSVSIS